MPGSNIWGKQQPGVASGEQTRETFASLKRRMLEGADIPFLNQTQLLALAFYADAVARLEQRVRELLTDCFGAAKHGPTAEPYKWFAEKLTALLGDKP